MGRRKTGLCCFHHPFGWSDSQPGAGQLAWGGQSGRIGISRSIATERARLGIRITVVAPD